MKSRRKFSKEFKQEAVTSRVGESVAEVARALEVHPVNCTAGGGSCRSTVRARSGVWATSAPKRARWPSWNGRSANRPWRSIF